MAGGGMVEGEGFWLPSEFFSDVDPKPEHVHSGSDFCFPSDFPYDFGTWAHRDLLQPTLAMATVVGSRNCRSGGGPNTAPSPKPFCYEYNFDGVEDLIRRAAGLKLNGSESFKPTTEPKNSLGPSTVNTRFPSTHAAFPPLTQHQQRFGMPYAKQRPLHEQDLNTWRIHRNPSTLRPIPVPRSAARKPCAGTGVFLPRRYGGIGNDENAFSSVSHHKTGPSPVIHGRSSCVHSRNNLMMMINGGAGLVDYSRPKHELHMRTGLIEDHGHSFTAALRTAILVQQQQRQKLRGGDVLV